VRLSMQEILDYKNCPQQYKFKHVDFLPEKKELKDHFKEIIRQTMSYYYFCMIDKNERSLNNLFTKWEQLWFCDEIENNFKEEDVRERYNMAVNIIINFYRYAAKEKVTPIAVDFKYDAMFEGPTNLHVVGTIPLIKVLNDKAKDRETNLVFFSYSSYAPDDFLSSIDINTTVASYAFRKNFDIRESNIILCNIGKKQEIAIHKSGSDFVRARKLLYNIATGIENRIFYPSDNRLSCNNCRFKIFCMNEKAMEDRDEVSKGLDNRT
jgi:hypothetical protein